MKALLLASLVMAVSISSSIEARSILVFRTIKKCSVVQKPRDLKLLVQKAQDGQTQIVLQPTNREEIRIQTEEYEAQGRAGAPVTYVGADDSGQELTFTINVRPIKVGRVTGRSAELDFAPTYSDLEMVCTSVN